MAHSHYTSCQPSEVQRLNAKRMTDEVRDAHVLHLNTGEVDTSRQATRRFGSRLVALASTCIWFSLWARSSRNGANPCLPWAVKMTSYIPNNAFLVYGSAKNELRALESWADSRSEVQWEGAYLYE